MANHAPMSTWRNFAAWSAAGAVAYILAMWGACSLVYWDVAGVMLRSKQAAALLGLGLLVSMATTGLTGRKRPLTFRNLRNFMIRYTAAMVVSLLFAGGFIAAHRAGVLGGMGISEWVAAVTGSALVVLAIVGTLATASVHTRADLIDDEGTAEEMRERTRLLLLSFVWTAAYGLLLIGLGLAGPGGVLSPAVAIAAALALIAVLTVLGIAAWRLSDELGRTLSNETGNIAFYLILVLGSFWAMLAHLGFLAAPAPLDWVTLFTVLMFVASFIAIGRRNLLTR